MNKAKALAAALIVFLSFGALYLVLKGAVRRDGQRENGRESGGYKGGEAAMATSTGNRLAGEKSPYLLQHADNPVDWYPWGGEAFEKAKAEDKPIFLSIGYSTCHWCHVMERDSFEDEEVAEILNRSFISIKVDREERLDIDSIYMAVCQAMTGGGGWPLTIIMTPDKKPFFAGTFFPADYAYGRKGLKTILTEISGLWDSNRDKLLAAAESATQIVQTTKNVVSNARPDEKALDRAFEIFSLNYDAQYGGFGGGGAKFPKAHEISFLLRYWKRTSNGTALEMAEKTLDGIYSGGMHDHIGGGYHRYSTDRKWLVPHFEKMLYDQAILSRAFLEAYQATGKQVYADAARDIFRYVLRDMTHPDGGFYSAEDADSEGEEGKFYVWKMEELKSLLGASDAKTFAEYYGVTENGNFENGTNILNVPGDRDEILRKSGASEGEAERALAGMRKKLFAAREKRVRPHRDDKIITSWNALMISSLAYGAVALGDRRYSEAAEEAADFILTNLYKKDGLLRRYRDGEAAIPAFLDDYAFLSLALIDLYEATLDPRRLEAARTIAGEMLRMFWDDKDSGFKFSSDKNEKLIGDVKQAYDGAEPSGNSVAALALLKLAEFTTDATYEEKANEIFSAFSGQIAGYPAGFTQMLIALDFALSPAMEVVVTGEAGDPALHDMFSAINAEFLPNKVVIFYPVSGDREQIESIVPFLKMKEMIDGMPTAYVCRDFTCKFPTTDVQALRKLLNQP